MKPLFILALLLSGCGPEDNHPPDQVPGSTAGTGGGGGTGGGSGAAGGNPQPQTWDSDMPTSTTWTHPPVASGQVYWRLVEGYYYGPGDSASAGGDHHIFFQAKDVDGTLLANQMGCMLTGGANPVYALTKEAVDQYKGNFPMYASGWCGTPIDDSAGPYSFLMVQDDLPSTRVDGMGLHCNFHMTWWLVYQKTVAP
jgi:hypothetical protein